MKHRVCHRMTAHLEGPVDLNDLEVAQWPIIKSIYTFPDPRLQAHLLNGYEWRVPQTDLILRMRHRDTSLNIVVHPMSCDIRGVSTTLLGTCSESCQYTNTNYSKVWMHDMDGYYSRMCIHTCNLPVTYFLPWMEQAAATGADSMLSSD